MLSLGYFNAACLAELSPVLFSTAINSFSALKKTAMSTRLCSRLTSTFPSSKTWLLEGEVITRAFFQVPYKVLKERAANTMTFFRLE